MFRANGGFLRQFQWSEIVMDRRGVVGPDARQLLLRILDVGVSGVAVVLVELGHNIAPGGPTDGGDKALHQRPDAIWIVGRPPWRGVVECAGSTPSPKDQVNLR